MPSSLAVWLSLDLQWQTLKTNTERDNGIELNWSELNLTDQLLCWLWLLFLCSCRKINMMTMINELGDLHDQKGNRHFGVQRKTTVRRSPACCWCMLRELRHQFGTWLTIIFSQVEKSYLAAARSSAWWIMHVYEYAVTALHVKSVKQRRRSTPPRDRTYFAGEKKIINMHF